MDFLRGSYVPLVTPFRRTEVDLDTFAALTRRQAAAGSAGIVVTGTSGEPSVLTVTERVRLYETAVAAAGEALPVVAATGSQSLAETVELTRQADKAGAAAVLVVTPYYIRPPQRGLLEYFVQVAATTTRPVLIYHIPGRAAVDLSVATLAEAVRRAPNIVGVKHASTDLAWATELLAELGPAFRLFCGLEEMSFPMLAIGAAGLMNAAGNIAPTPINQLCQAVADGDLATARTLHFELFTLNQAVFWDTNPIPIKYLMKGLGLLPDNEHRLPMRPPAPETQARLDALLPRLRAMAGLEGAQIGRGGARRAEAAPGGTARNHLDHDGHPPTLFAHPLTREESSVTVQNTALSTEWLTVATSAGPMRVYAARPAAATGRAVVVLQEAFGVNDHIQDVARRLAARGFLALAPDLFHRTGVAELGYDQHAEAVGLIGAIDPDQIATDVRAMLEHLHVNEGVGGDRTAVIGFCFGGRAAFTAATAVPGLAAAVVFYGPGIAAGPHAVLDRAGSVDAPLLLHVGAEDPTIPAAQVEEIDAALRAAGVGFDQHVYSGAGHAFACDARPHMLHRQAADTAWERTHTFLDKHLPPANDVPS